MTRVAMVVSTIGYHWEEVVGALKEFTQAGCAIEFYTVDGKAPKADPVSLKFTGPLSLFGLGISRSIGPGSSIGRKAHELLARARPLTEWDTSLTDIVYLPGGHGCLFDMNRSEELHAKIAQVHARGKVLSGVCHATSTFAFVTAPDGSPITRGKRITGFPHPLDQVLVKARAVSAKFLPIPFSNDRALMEGGALLGAKEQALAALFPAYTRVDPPFVTGMGPKAARSVARKALKLARAT